MKFVKVDVLPARGNNTSNNKILHQFLTDFLGSNIEVARVEWGKDEYLNHMSCYTSLNKAALRYEMPIRVISRNGNIYLVRV